MQNHISSTANNTTAAHSGSSATTSSDIKPHKANGHFWFPFSLEANDLTTTSATPNSVNKSKEFQMQTDKLNLQSQFSPPLSAGSRSSSGSASTPSSCRYSDIFSSYASIVSEMGSTRSTALPFSPLTELLTGYQTGHQIQHHQLQHQRSKTPSLAPSPASSGGLFQYSPPLSGYPSPALLSSLSTYETAVGNARCALPSPTIYPPTPPPSVPWNPWSGF